MIKLISFTLVALAILNSSNHVHTTDPELTATTNQTNFSLSDVLKTTTLQPQATAADSITITAKDSAPTTTFNLDATTTSEDDSITSTTDSIGISSNSNSTIIINDDSQDHPSSGEGIEAKSISNSDGEANSFDTDGDKNAKVVLTEEATADSSENSQRPKVKHSNKAVNMSDVDHIYNEGRRSEPQIIESWLKMEKKLKKGIGSLIGSIVPQALNMTQEAKISNECSGAMLKWILSLNHLKAWALKMLDASGKPIAGLLEGSLTMFGNYRQCLRIRAPDDDEIEFSGGEFAEYFRGKYCIIQAKPWLPEKDRFYGLNSKIKGLMENSEDNPWYDRNLFDEINEWLLAFNYINIRMDLCIPSKCSREDIQSVLNFLLRGIDFKARVLRCEMDSKDGSYSSVIETNSPEISEALVAAASTVSGDDVHDTKLDPFSQLSWCTVPLVAIVLVLLATFASSILCKDDQEDIDDQSGKFKHTIKSLSLGRSLSSHLNIDYDQLADDKPLALYGIRLILVMWVLFVESAINLKFEFLRELLYLKDLIFWWPLQIIINSTIQYDSIILLTAFTMSYKNCLNEQLMASSKSNIRCLIKFILDKYIRLMPSVLLTVAFTILLPLLYRGPVWNDYVTKQSAICQSTGWLNTLFLQNYLPYKEICLPHTWLFCVEFQLILLMVPVVYYLNKSYATNYNSNNNNNNNNNNKDKSNKKSVLGNNYKDEDIIKNNDSSKLFYWVWTAPGAFLIGCIVIGLSCSFYNVYTKDLPPSWYYTMPDPDSKAIYFGEHFMRVWTHLAVFAIGIIAGIECRRASKNTLRSHNSIRNNGTDINCGYRGANINFANSSSLSTSALNNQMNNNGLKKDQFSSSTASLPVMASSIATSTDSLSSTDRNNISININNEYGSNDNIGSDSNSKRNLAALDGDNKGGKGFVSIMVDIVCFALVITTMSLIIFSTYDWSINDLPKPLIAGLYDSFSRFLWSLAFIWILYKCSVPNNNCRSNQKFSIIARLLGHPMMVCLGKLSFLIYLIHPLVHITVLAIQEQPIYSSWLMLFHILIGNMTITIILASLVSIFVEMPCRNLFRRCETSILLTKTITTPTGSGVVDNISTSSAAAAAAGATCSSCGSSSANNTTGNVRI